MPPSGDGLKGGQVNVAEMMDILLDKNLQTDGNYLVTATVEARTQNHKGSYIAIP